MKATELETTPVVDAANRVAKVTLAFWIMKICATTVGETAGDMLSMTLNIGYAIDVLWSQYQNPGTSQ